MCEPDEPIVPEYDSGDYIETEEETIYNDLGGQYVYNSN